jgi:hypothetical protein
LLGWLVKTFYSNAYLSTNRICLFHVFIHQASSSTPRVVVNMEAVGASEGLDYDGKDKNNQRDFLVSAYSDQVFLSLCIQLGWAEDLLAYKHLMAPSSQELLQNVHPAVK